MSTSGIVRKIDNLGRVVIPKELRKTLHIEEGDPFEIFAVNGVIVLGKYCPASDLSTYAERLKNAVEENAETLGIHRAFDIAGHLNRVEDLLKEAKGDKS